MTPKRPRGRPRVYSDRWYALFCLHYCLAEKLAVEESERRLWRSEQRVRPTQRRLTALRMKVPTSRVTKTLAKAQQLKLFTRGERIWGNASRRRTRGGGYLTDAGWEALGPVPAGWLDLLGNKPIDEIENDWQRINFRRLSDHDVRRALGIIEDEMERERNRWVLEPPATATPEIA